MSKQMVPCWCRQFPECQSVDDEERSGRPSLINVDLVELVRQRVLENRRLTITEQSSQFPQISRSLLHKIVTKHLLFKKFVKTIRKNKDVCHTLLPFKRRQSDTKIDPTIKKMSQFWW
ncbi:HTH_48 domain-containing protein [Trichonephila clavipes]|uniref:HTH_48 domain-containing protein n=1 Tax=Trichonephila clavipes TaxID=2585209 RepID=A0A8X6UWV1_TRICX|nr:HTH_48 domain-containing protein [Trichonephila clavipes]